MNLRDALAHEERNLGEPIHVLDHHWMKGKVLSWCCTTPIHNQTGTLVPSGHIA